MARLFRTSVGCRTCSILTAVLLAANARKVRDLTRTVRAIFPLQGRPYSDGSSRACAPGSFALASATAKRPTDSITKGDRLSSIIRRRLYIRRRRCYWLNNMCDGYLRTFPIMLAVEL